MKTYNDEELNPAQCNLYDPLTEDFEEPKTMDKILDHLNISKNEYERALTVSDEGSFQIHTKRPPNSCFGNSYFSGGLQAWNAVIVSQYLVIIKLCLTYLCICLSEKIIASMTNN